MNLHKFVAPTIGAVNKFIPATARRSAGYTTNAAGQRTPALTNIPVSLQIQALSYTDITKLNGLNIQGVRRKIYTSGTIFGLIRVGQKGGDLIVFPAGSLPEGDVWLAAHVLEQWNDGAGNPAWVSIAITLQDGS